MEQAQDFTHAHILMDQVGVPREEPVGYELTLTDRVAILCERYDSLLFEGSLQHEVLDRLGVPRGTTSGASYPPDSRIMIARMEGTKYQCESRRMRSSLVPVAPSQAATSPPSPVTSKLPAVVPAATATVEPDSPSGETSPRS